VGRWNTNSAGTTAAYPIDLSNYNFAHHPHGRNSTDSNVGFEFFMYTGPGFIYQKLTGTLPVDGAFHDLVFPLSTFNHLYVDGEGIDLLPHAGDLAISVDSVVFSQQVPEPGSLALVGVAVLTLARRTRQPVRV